MKHLAYLLLLLSACAYRTPRVDVPSSVPPIAARDLVIDDVVVTDGGQQADPLVAAGVRCEVTRLLLGAVAERGARRGAAHVRIAVDLQDRRGIEDAMREDGFASIALFGAPFGLVLARERLAVHLTLDAGGRTLVGGGRADKLGSIYAPARRRALASALDAALASLGEKNRLPPENLR
jgi:hypothetical protein